MQQLPRHRRQAFNTDWAEQWALSMPTNFPARRITPEDGIPYRSRGLCVSLHSAISAASRAPSQPSTAANDVLLQRLRRAAGVSCRQHCTAGRRLAQRPCQPSYRLGQGRGLWPRSKYIYRLQRPLSHSCKPVVRFYKGLIFFLTMTPIDSRPSLSQA